MRKASIFSRLAAIIIDLLIVILLSAMIFAAAAIGYRMGSGRLTFLDLFSILFFSFVLSSLVCLFYFTYLTMDEGKTIGKSLVGIKVVTMIGAGSGLGFYRALVRALAYSLSALLFLPAFIMAAFFKGRTIHDILAGTRVVRVNGAETKEEL